jgi:AraC family transcriptional regulator
MDMSHTTVSELTDEYRKVAHGSMTGSDVTAPLFADQAGDACRFGADVLLKRSGAWGGGKAILIDRQPRAQRTEFKHRLARHAIVLHLEGANSRTVLRYDGGPRVAAGCTLGQVMLIPASRDLEGWSDYQARVRHIMVLLDPSLLETETREGADGGAFELTFHSDLNDGVIASRMRALQAELENPGLLGRLYIDSLSSEIAIRLVRMHAARPERLHRGGLSPRCLRLVKDYIAQNLAKEITLSDIAAVAGVSSGHFCRAFHKSAGIPSHQYVVRQRIELAKKLLTESDTPIAQIALAAGFGNQSHLTRHFHAVVGTTPRRFRNEA